MGEIRGIAGPIAQRYFDKIENERQARQAKSEAALMAKRAQEEATKREAEAKAEGSKKEDTKDEEMVDVPEPGKVDEEVE